MDGPKAGATAHIDLWFDPQTGAYTVLNDKRENMPVEALWCGLAGRAYDTRSAIALDRTARRVPGAIALTCAETSADRLDCR